MADPAQSISQHLLNHVHLIASYNFPLSPHPPNAEYVLENLLQAPHILRDKAPVSWQYLQQPREGLMMLAWQPLSQLGTGFATDGYVWTRPEGIYTQNLRGFSMEIFVADAGYAPGKDMYTVRRRMRWRLVGRPDNAPIDPALEIIHYSSASQIKIPASSMQLPPEVQQQLRQREYLDRHGPLDGKEFMLGDRNNYPTMQMPPGPGGLPHNRLGMQSLPPQFAGQQMRPQVGMAGQMGMHRKGMPSMGRPPMMSFREEQLLKDEEGGELGDGVDYLLPRDISGARYSHHHEWMDQILHMPWPVSKIIPEPLGLAPAGEIGAAVNSESLDRPSMEKTKAFEEDIASYIQKGEQQLIEMVAEHQKKVQQFGERDRLNDLERRLAASGDGDDGSEILSEAEALMGRVRTREGVTCVQQGALVPTPAEPDPVVKQVDDFSSFTNFDTAGEALDLYEANLDFT